MTTVEFQKIEKMVTENTRLARKALHKSNELEAYLSLLQYRSGQVKKKMGVDDILSLSKEAKRLKKAGKLPILRSLRDL